MKSNVLYISERCYKIVFNKLHNHINRKVNSWFRLTHCQGFITTALFLKFGEWMNLWKQKESIIETTKFIRTTIPIANKLWNSWMVNMFPSFTRCSFYLKEISSSHSSHIIYNHSNYISLETYIKNSIWFVAIVNRDSPSCITSNVTFCIVDKVNITREACCPWPHWQYTSALLLLKCNCFPGTVNVTDFQNSPHPVKLN